MHSQVEKKPVEVHHEFLHSHTGHLSHTQNFDNIHAGHHDHGHDSLKTPDPMALTATPEKEMQF
mgnify:CR=1 FL=1